MRLCWRACNRAADSSISNSDRPNGSKGLSVMPEDTPDAESTRVDRSRPRPCPWGFFGAVGLIVIVETVVSARHLDFTTLSAYDWRLTGQAVVREAPKSEILVFGDSLLKFGMVSDILERRLEAKFFNLSLMGGQSVSSYFLLRRAIEAGARPKAILQDCQDQPAVAGRPQTGVGVREHIRDWQELLDFRELRELRASIGDDALFHSVLLGRLLPTVKNYHEIRDRKIFWTKDGRFFAHVQRRNFERNRGSILAPRAERPPPSPSLALMNSPRLEWISNSMTSEYLDKFFRLAESRSIPVFFLLPPTSPEHQSLREKVGQKAYYTRQAEAIRARYPSVTIFDARESRYDRAYFIDDTHLDRVGASIYSKDLAEAVAATLSGPKSPMRWVNLPKCRAGVEGKLGEDIDSSILAVAPNHKPRR